jgi:Domain of unknown function (DU1801)
MAENKTKPTDAAVAQYLAQIEGDERRQDCVALAALMTKVTKHPPQMWGVAIVGFGVLKYKYESGREGETCVLGFASRKGDISVYGTASAPLHATLLAKLGKHKMGKGCLYIKRLSDVDLGVLEQLFLGAVGIKDA